jgi:pyruvate/2-oxoglutarate dehydrogenase complex dihydrolipoamide dehydrogenase (E3) component
MTKIADILPTGVRVKEYLQSVTNPAVYAAGDAAASGLPKLTPVAGYEGRIVASNLLKGNHRNVESCIGIRMPDCGTQSTRTAWICAP